MGGHNAMLQAHSHARGGWSACWLVATHPTKKVYELDVSGAWWGHARRQTERGMVRYLERVLPDAVNLVNDLHVTRQQLAHDLDRPLLQSLWHDCVVGEGQSLQTRETSCNCTTEGNRKKLML